MFNTKVKVEVIGTIFYSTSQPVMETDLQVYTNTSLSFLNCSAPPMQSVPIITKVVSLNPDHGQVFSIQHYVIKVVSDLRWVGGFLRVLLFPPQRYITEILLKVALNTITIAIAMRHHQAIRDDDSTIITNHPSSYFPWLPERPVLAINIKCTILSNDFKPTSTDKHKNQNIFITQ